MAHARMLLPPFLLGLALGSACGGAASDGTLLTPYLAVGSALAADQVEPLPELGTAIARAAEGHAGEPGVAAIVQGAGGLATPDIQAARTAFATMSQGMIEYLAAHPEQQAGHTLVHCPMTFSGKGGLWVQAQGKIMNPYEGARMLHCGDKLAWDATLPAT